ncbi:monovalent cation:proton antiporter-2 (CPA2) family protein [Roseibacillus ishigakijimensis]|uniref:Cation:proton antiporter n=1 Tax=Roseibacillus ishigakijimensis TaxID=454146 RepID=A0A934RW41_9BACT|nr:monovalent cation:proton antiporter-2 (CPA2) family protein [Roseibacillus ishigakijimensis]MBK1835230.1 cation:proton antiporter [Roseibacillus ishigakijimensis]
MSNQSLFTSAFVYLLAAVISVPVAKRLGLSSVLGYLVAGMIIGPFGIQLVGEEGADVMHFAEFGVVMMLFLVGLEVQPSRLWKMRGPILGLGGAQVGITIAVVAGLGLFLGLDWQVALAIGMALALSSTAIALQSLQEKGQTKSRAGQSAFSVLLFQDLAVIPILAVMPLLATLTPAGADHHHADLNALQAWLSHQPPWVNTVLVLVAVVLIVVAGKYLFQPLLGWVARTRVRETFVALALSLVIGIALLMTSLGVSAALGTFLAGMLLSDSEYRAELEADIEPFKGLLLGVFFIAVGASIDFDLIASQPLNIAALVLALIALKGVILFALAKWAGLCLDGCFLFGFVLAQGSEFAFVILGFGISEGVLPLEIGQLVTAVVAISMAMTPLLLIFNDKVLRPRFGTREQEAPPADDMDEEAPVILAGMGRFGNFVARMLRAQGIEVTIIDNDPEHIDFLRNIGVKTFYGDASRVDLLEAAGAAEARVLVIALDQEETINELVASARKHFPQLQIMVRALSRDHQYELLEAGVDYTIHQHAGSAIAMGEETLKTLGFRAHRAARLGKIFARHDRESFEQLNEVRKDEKAYVHRIRERLSDIEDQFKRENSDFAKDPGWDTERLRKDSLPGLDQTS